MGGVPHVIVALREQVCLPHYKCLTLRLMCHNQINRVFAPSSWWFWHPTTKTVEKFLKTFFLSGAVHGDNRGKRRAEERSTLIHAETA
jgi:hypothetical protein